MEWQCTEEEEASTGGTDAVRNVELEQMKTSLYADKRLA